ncbi:unnamed protein product [Malus baccata var. baccata]
MQPILVSILCLIPLVFSEVLGQTEDACKELKCGWHGPAIHFPFRIKDKHPKHCGYPGFLVSCNERNETVLELPNIPVKFSVTSIDYKHQEIQLYDPDNCLSVKVLEIQNMSFSPFDIYTNNITLFNCSLVLEGSSAFAVPCLSSPGHHIYAFASSYYVGELQSCSKMYNRLSVPFSFYEPEALWLYWSEPNCTKCEAEGNTCRLKNNSTNSNEIECVLDLKKPSMNSTGINTTATSRNLNLQLETIVELESNE